MESTAPRRNSTRWIAWAQLLKRVFDIDTHTRPNCGGGELKIIATFLERPVIRKILSHLGLDSALHDRRASSPPMRQPAVGDA
ncbi:hypothetical protein D621_07460 [beta proteobacterium AAP51]|nr:hypothetical protein D621_07460 [beta proteobacterium AAP51]